MEDATEIETLVKLLQQEQDDKSSANDDASFMRYRYNSVFQFLLDCLVGSGNGIPPSLRLGPFITETIEFCRTILAERYYYTTSL